MDDVKIGNRFRGLRHRRDWRQEDLGARANVSQDVVSRIERGHLGAVTLEKLRRVAAELEADVVVQLRWRAGDLDRLADEGHANLVGRVLEFLRARSWEVRAEVTYSIYGARGSVDILAWHTATRTLLVVEVKTELTSAEETLRKHDEKVRLGARIAGEQFGWRPTTVGRLLVLPEGSTARRRLDRIASVLDAAYPIRRGAARDWLARPAGAFAGLVFVTATETSSRGGRSARSRRRIRVRETPPKHRLAT